MREGGGATGMTATDWFEQTLRLPERAMLPAVATKLARGDADDAVALWEAWRAYVAETPGMLADERAHALAATLRRSVETLACTAYADVAWAAQWRGAPDAVPDLAWDLLVSDAPLTASALRSRAGTPGMPLVVSRVQAGGKRLPNAERGPFVLAL